VRTSRSLGTHRSPRMSALPDQPPFGYRKGRNAVVRADSELAPASCGGAARAGQRRLRAASLVDVARRHLDGRHSSQAIDLHAKSGKQQLLVAPVK
jgi:hypothetical protein